MLRRDIWGHEPDNGKVGIICNWSNYGSKKSAAENKLVSEYTDAEYSKKLYILSYKIFKEHIKTCYHVHEKQTDRDKMFVAYNNTKNPLLLDFYFRMLDSTVMINKESVFPKGYKIHIEENKSKAASFVAKMYIRLLDVDDETAKEYIESAQKNSDYIAGIIRRIEKEAIECKGKYDDADLGVLTGDVVYR